jgi:hypothetical protein
MTTKDRERVETLITYTAAYGLTAGAAKAERDAVKIEQVAKCEARAALLEQRGQRFLAKPFRDRAAWLRANLVTT